MSIKAFDCNKIKHSLWPFTFKDQEDENGNITKGRTIMVRMPMKSTFEKIQAIQDMSETDPEALRADDTVNALHELVAEILTNNLENPNPAKPKKRVKAAELENYTIEELIAIIQGFNGFTDNLKNDPN